MLESEPVEDENHKNEVHFSTQVFYLTSELAAFLASIENSLLNSLSSLITLLKLVTVKNKTALPRF